MTQISQRNKPNESIKLDAIKKIPIWRNMNIRPNYYDTTIYNNSSLPRKFKSKNTQFTNEFLFNFLPCLNFKENQRIEERCGVSWSINKNWEQLKISKQEEILNEFARNLDKNLKQDASQKEIPSDIANNRKSLNYGNNRKIKSSHSELEEEIINILKNIKKEELKSLGKTLETNLIFLDKDYSLETILDLELEDKLNAQNLNGLEKSNNNYKNLAKEILGILRLSELELYSKSPKAEINNIFYEKIFTLTRIYKEIDKFQTYSIEHHFENISKLTRHGYIDKALEVINMMQRFNGEDKARKVMCEALADKANIINKTLLEMVKHIDILKLNVKQRKWFIDYIFSEISFQKCKIDQAIEIANEISILKIKDESFWHIFKVLSLDNTLLKIAKRERDAYTVMNIFDTLAYKNYNQSLQISNMISNFKIKDQIFKNISQTLAQNGNGRKALTVANMASNQGKIELLKNVSQILTQQIIPKLTHNGNSRRAIKIANMLSPDEKKDAIVNIISLLIFKAIKISNMLPDEKIDFINLLIKTKEFKKATEIIKNLDNQMKKDAIVKIFNSIILKYDSDIAQKFITEIPYELIKKGRVEKNDIWNIVDDLQKINNKDILLETKSIGH